MKKYVKPELIFEQYELNQHIADCAWEMNNLSKEVCDASFDEKMVNSGVFGKLFTETVGTCDLTSNTYQDYCETNGPDGINTWKS